MSGKSSKTGPDQITVVRTTSARVSSIVRTYNQRFVESSLSTNASSLASHQSMFRISFAKWCKNSDADINHSSRLPTFDRKSSSTSSGANTYLDAKSNVNLNYRSPYRNTSSVYRSFGKPRNPADLRIAGQTKTSSNLLEALDSTKLEPSTKNGKLVVKKTGKTYDANSIIPTYQTHSQKRGAALIINNIMFKDNGYRDGAKEDDKKMKEMLKQMGFDVTVERDLTKSKMLSTVKSFSKKSLMYSRDIALVVVMSHGTRNKTVGGTEVFGIDEAGVMVDELMEPFNEQNCKAMSNKPKIFIFQCCRGDNEVFIQRDATPFSSKVSVLADTLIAYSTLPGFVSHRSPNTGTWYISTLCEVFSMHAHEYHVEDLLKMVDVKLNAHPKAIRQITHYENRGFRRCFLHPK